VALGLPATGTIARVGLGFDITHTWDADVDVYLTPPGGTAMDMTTDNGGGLPNYTATVPERGRAAGSGARPSFCLRAVDRARGGAVERARCED